jgi:prepilin-type N-terminal cleavage/methylation domain-containing protein
MRVRTQRGFTLIELMVALVVSSLLVGLILAIFSRMSLAYRGQQQIAGLQQVLAAARATIEADAKQAGFGMPQGFRFAADAGTQPKERWPVRVYDNATGKGPDQIAFFYADASAQAVVTAGTLVDELTVTMDPTSDGFVANQIVVVTTPDFTTANGSSANLTKYEACLLQVQSFTAGPPAKLTFSLVPPYGRPNQDHCAGVTFGSTMVYKFAARGYRIEPQVMNPGPSRPEQGPLQLSDTGGMFGDEAKDRWADLAFGFTDIQTALRVYDGDPANIGLGSTDFDSDGDATKEWLSGGQQTTVTDRSLSGALDARTAPLLMTISLVARTDRDVEGVGTAQTPLLIGSEPRGPGGVVAKTEANSIGNHESFNLTTTDDAALVPTVLDPRGSRILRYLTFQVDFRNLGVGR